MNFKQRWLEELKMNSKGGQSLGDGIQVIFRSILK